MLKLLFKNQVLEYAQHRSIFVCLDECVAHFLGEQELLDVAPSSLCIFWVCVALLPLCFICLLSHGFLGLAVVNGALFELVFLVVNLIDEEL